MRIVAQVLAVSLVALLLALLGWRLFHHPAAPKAGKPAPQFALARLNGSGKLRLSALRGHGVLINFWSSTCVPCAAEAPFLQQVASKNAARGLVVVGVDPEDIRSDADRFLTKHHITYPNVNDVGYRVADRYAVTGTPESFFVDRKGRLVPVHIIGPADASQNRSELARGIKLALES